MQTVWLERSGKGTPKMPSLLCTKNEGMAKSESSNGKGAEGKVAYSPDIERARLFVETSARQAHKQSREKQGYDSPPSGLVGFWFGYKGRARKHLSGYEGPLCILWSQSQSTIHVKRPKGFRPCYSKSQGRQA